MVKLPKLAIFDHDHGQNFKIAVVKWAKLAIFDLDHGQYLRITVVNGQNWSILTIGPGRNRGCHGHLSDTSVTLQVHLSDTPGTPQ